MEIQYQLSQADFREALFAHRKVRPFTRWFYRILIVSLVGMGLFVLLGVAAERSTRHLANLAPLLSLIAMWAGLLWLFPIWSARNQFRKQPGVQGTRTVSIDDTGIRSRWDGGSLDTQWKIYLRSFEARNVVMLYTSPVCFNIFPKRAFQPEQLAEFRSLLKEKLAANR